MSNKSFNIVMETQQDIHFVPLSHDQNKYFVMSFFGKDNALQKCEALQHRFSDYKFFIDEKPPSKHIGNAFPEMFKEMIFIMLRGHPNVKKKASHLTLVKG
jgi:hypothetical protein